MEADQSRSGEMSRSNVSESRLMRPLFPAASLTSCRRGLSCAARMMAGRASKERNGRSMVTVAKSKEIRGHGLAERSRSRSGGGLANNHHVSCSPPTSIPLSFLLFCPCRLALSHVIFRQHRHHVLSHTPTPGIHHRRASGRVGFHMVNTDVRYKHPMNLF